MPCRWFSLDIKAKMMVEYNLTHTFVRWYKTWCMNGYVSREINGCVAKYRNESINPVADGKSIVSLVITRWLSESAASKPQVKDSTLKDFAINLFQLSLNHSQNVTSNTICYIYYALATNPGILGSLLSEYNEVIGPNASTFGSRIIEDPSILDRLPTTLAFIKEALRLFPPVSSLRIGEDEFHVRDDHHHRFPTNGFLVWADTESIYRDPKHWPQPGRFLIKRWRVKPGHWLHPVEGAYRPFEHGPHDCIGQELVMMQLKIIMVMTVGRFNLKLAYDELDQEREAEGKRTVRGERGYRTWQGQPSDGLPCRVTLK